MREEEKVAKARRQLIIIGVTCVTVVIFTIWLVSLKTTIAQNRKQYSSPFESLKGARSQVGSAWQQFREQLNQLR